MDKFSSLFSLSKSGSKMSFHVSYIFCEDQANARFVSLLMKMENEINKIIAGIRESEFFPKFLVVHDDIGKCYLD